MPDARQRIDRLKGKEFSVNREINVLALLKGEERYVFVYNEENRSETMRTLGRYASNPELNFSWYDAAVLSQKMRRESHRESLSARYDKFSASDHFDKLNRQGNF